MTKIFHIEVAEKAKFTGLLDNKSEYIVILSVNSELNGKIEVFHKSFKLGYSG